MLSPGVKFKLSKWMPSVLTNPWLILGLALCYQYPWCWITKYFLLPSTLFGFYIRYNWIEEPVKDGSKYKVGEFTFSKLRKESR